MPVQPSGSCLCDHGLKIESWLPIFVHKAMFCPCPFGPCATIERRAYLINMNVYLIMVLTKNRPHTHHTISLILQHLIWQIYIWKHVIYIWIYSYTFNTKFNQQNEIMYKYVLIWTQCGKIILEVNVLWFICFSYNWSLIDLFVQWWLGGHDSYEAACPW